MRFSVTLPFQLAWDLIAWYGQGIGVGEPALLCVLPTADWAEHPEGNGLAVTPAAAHPLATIISFRPFGAPLQA